jgi:D-alanyl-lipoteichoic acid acyltransferase DltB (MBOAT superfamily)
MLFNTPQFGVFLAVVLAGYWSLPRPKRAPWLLATSLVFYALWLPEYLLLLVFDAGVSFLLLRRMAGSAHPRRWLAANVVFVLGVLAWFKYAAFLIASALPVLGLRVDAATDLPEIFLPLGISFYSFQMIGLAVDCYRGSIAAPERFRRYLLFVSFFPQLIAGPILRGRQLLPQLEAMPTPSRDQVRRGVWLLAVGAAKKMILADWLLAPFVDIAFLVPGQNSAPHALLGLYSFAFQIYFDFSGYTDMARGAGLLLGFELPLNFREPYLSRSPSEFWRRWHITLSEWLRDYLYIPLGGNRATQLLTNRNLFLTMLLGGLWHGASWTFVIWGGLHGVLLIGERLVSRERGSAETPLRIADAWRILLFFHVTCLLWLFFRAESFAGAAEYLRVLFSFRMPFGWPVTQTGIVLGCFALHVLERLGREGWPEFRASLEDRAWGPVAMGAAIGLVLAIAFAAGGTGADFIYFQF